MYEDTAGPRARPRKDGGRIAAIVAAGVIALLSIGFLTVGGLLLWGDSQKDADGYLSTRTDRFNTRTAALATENLDVDLGGTSSVLDTDVFGKLRLRAESQDGKPVFVGIARTSDVSRYLRGTAHEVVTDIDTSPFHADYSTKDGNRTVEQPGRQHIWAASAHGDGRQTLTWDVDDGNWSVVVMNADGSPGVHAAVSAGASVGWLDDAGRVSITTGVVLLFIAGGLFYLGVRPRRHTGGPVGETVVVAA
jgi:hypothetical protein